MALLNGVHKDINVFWLAPEVATEHQEPGCGNAAKKIAVNTGIHASDRDDHEPCELLAKLEAGNFVIDAGLQWVDRLGGLWHHGGLWPLGDLLDNDVLRFWICWQGRNSARGHQRYERATGRYDAQGLTDGGHEPRVVLACGDALRGCSQGQRPCSSPKWTLWVCGGTITCAGKTECGGDHCLGIVNGWLCGWHHSGCCPW